jgi:hypothetical protein
MGQHSAASWLLGGRIFTTTTSDLLLAAAVGSVSYLSKHGSCFDSVECYVCVCVCARYISVYSLYVGCDCVLDPHISNGSPGCFLFSFLAGRESQVQPSGEHSSSSTANPLAVRCISHPMNLFVPHRLAKLYTVSLLSSLHLSSTVTTLRR